MKSFKEFLLQSLSESDRDSQIQQITGALKNLSDKDFRKVCNHFEIPANDQKLSGSYKIIRSDIKLTEPIFNDENIPAEFAEIDPTSKDISREILMHLRNCMNPSFSELIKITKVKKVEDGYSIGLIYAKDGSTAEYIFA